MYLTLYTIFTQYVAGKYNHSYPRILREHQTITYEDSLLLPSRREREAKDDFSEIS